MKHYFRNNWISSIFSIILVIGSSLNALGQNNNYTVPKFEMISVDGNIQESKPQLAQRINGATDLIIVYPSNSSILDEIICTSLYDYFSSIGIPVSYHYAPYDKEQITGNITILRGSCALTDIDFVTNSNTLVMIPNYVWGYGRYSNRLDIHLNIFDVAGGNYWKQILDGLSINSEKHRIDKKLIKKLQKQITAKYNYNPNFSVKPIRMKCNWSEHDFRRYCDNNPQNMIEGIYDINGEKIGVHIDDAGLCYMIYLSGSDFDWEEGELKGLLEPTSTPNIYKGHLSDKYRREEPITAVFEHGLISYSVNDDEFTSYVKMYPKITSPAKGEVKTWSGTGFALNNGYVVTNHHVIEDATKIIIHGVNGDFKSVCEASVIGVDTNNDLALLKISDSSFKGFGNIPYGVSSTTSEVGEEVYVLGYPMTSTMGDEIKLTNGIISSKTGFKGDVSLYQISAPIQPGNSGGPLFDNKGNIIGIVNAKHAEAENVGYAIKSLYLRNLVESCVSTSILPNKNTVSVLPLTGKVKSEKNFIFLIECSK